MFNFIQYAISAKNNGRSPINDRPISRFDRLNVNIDDLLVSLNELFVINAVKYLQLSDQKQPIKLRSGRSRSLNIEKISLSPNHGGRLLFH